MADYYRVVDELAHDNLISGVSPDTEIQTVTLLALAQAATYPKGTLLGVHTAGIKAGKCVILGTAAGGGEAIEPAFVLAEETAVGVAEDVAAPAYSSGCFAPEGVTVADNYTLTQADIDGLRTRNIVFKSIFH
ncbi:MAG: hypothetical protein PHH32_02410 [Eubacteriales bacterium]|nr:hypothetical protein [Eubacteriales bacterium]